MPRVGRGLAGGELEGSLEGLGHTSVPFLPPGWLLSLHPAPCPPSWGPYLTPSCPGPCLESGSHSQPLHRGALCCLWGPHGNRSLRCLLLSPSGDDIPKAQRRNAICRRSHRAGGSKGLPHRCPDPSPTPYRLSWENSPYPLYPSPF